MPEIIPMSDINTRFFNKNSRISSMSCGASSPTYFKGNLLKIKDLSLSISRVLSCTVIYLGLPSPTSSSDVNGNPSDGQPYWRIPNLAAGGVYMAYCVTTISVSSYLAFPSLPQAGDTNCKTQGIATKLLAAVYFCCTVPEVTLAWRYQAPCPMLLGLSSWSKDPATV